MPGRPIQYKRNYVQKNMLVIFLLSDPRDGMPKYVGHSKNPEKRWRKLRKAGNRHKVSAWLKELKRERLNPDVTILTEVYPENLSEHLRYYREVEFVALPSILHEKCGRKPGRVSPGRLTS